MTNTVEPAPGRALAVLLVSAFAFAVTFAAWMMFGVTGIPIRQELGLNASEFGLLTATPVLTDTRGPPDPSTNRPRKAPR